MSVLLGFFRRRSQRSSGVAGQSSFFKRSPSVTILRVLAEINMNGVDFLVVGCFVSVLILRPHGVQGGVFRNGKCTRHEGHRIFGGLSRNQVGLSLAPTQEHCLFLCQTAAVLNCNSAAVQILIRILHGPASTICIISNGKLFILVVGRLVSVLIFRPHGVQGGVFRNGKCTRHEGHRIFGGLSRNQVGLSLAPTQEHCLFLCQTAAVLNCNSAAVQILIRILHGPASTIRIISNGKLLIFVIRNSVSVCIRSPDSEQSDIVCNGHAGYKLHLCCSFFGLNQVGFSFAPAKESSVILCETAATLDSDRCILTIGVAVCYNTFAAICIVSDPITGNVNNSAVYIYRIGCAIGFCIGQGCALIG